MPTTLVCGIRRGLKRSPALLAFAALLLGSASDSSAQNGCIDLDTTIELSGYLISTVLPGSPGFADVTKGDDAELIDLLLFEYPVCVEDDQGARVVVEIAQLSCEQEQIERMREGVPQTIKASFFVAFTGHHHTTVLAQCE